MKNLLLILLTVDLSAIFGCMIFSLKKKNRISHTLTAICGVTISTILFYILYAFNQNIFAARLFSSFHFACIDWLLILVIVFIIKVTSISPKKIKLSNFLNGLSFIAVIDTISLCLNCLLKHTVDFLPVLDDNRKFICWILFYKLPFHFHLGFSYFLIGCFLFFAIYRVASLPSMYQRKYFGLIIIYILVIAANAMFLVLKWPFDFSVLFYSVALFSFFYFSYFKMPKEFSGIVMEQVIFNVNSAIICYDMFGKCIYINKVAEQIFEISKSEDKNFLVESYLMRWKRVYPNFDKEIRTDDDYFVIDGEIHTFRGELRPLKDAKDRLIGYFIKLDDRTNELKALEKEEYLATHDSLTGLLNQESFFKKAHEILLEDPEVQRYMVCTDIENFKLINDLFGEEIGNEILIAQARALEKAKYESCIYGRVGGDKFAMLIAKTDFKADLAINNTNVIQNILYERHHYRFHTYIGVYEIADPMENVESMCDKAQLAINRITGDFSKTLNFYDMSIMQQLINEKTILADFPGALESGQFLFYIQPQFVAGSERVLGGEALVRWNHPINGILGPNDFVHILEHSDYISNLDAYIWEAAVKKLAEWKKLGFEEYYISVNISAKDFYYVDLYEVFTHLVEKYDVNPKNLNLEVTETVLMYNVTMHQEILNKLRGYGFTIEMDDFGSGYSSLSTLRNLSMDVLKIDMEFLRSTENYEQSLKIIHSIIEMAKALNMTVITEGVELKHQAEALKEMGCDIFQGYYFSRPVTVDVFEKRYLTKEV